MNGSQDASPGPVPALLLRAETSALTPQPPVQSKEEDSDTETFRLDLGHFKVLNQELTWVVHNYDLVNHFENFKSRQEFSLARDGIADLRRGSDFRNSLPAQVATAAAKVEPIKSSIHTRWPSLEGILTRVFAQSHYDEVSKALRDEDSHDPLVGYILYVVLSYGHYFTFHDQIPTCLNEREGFMDLVWPFIRGAMTLARIETRSLEILISGVQERKNLDKNPFQDTQQVGQFADGIAFRGSAQLYLSEAALLHSPKADKAAWDEFKLARAMRDSWISQVRSACRETVPRRGMAVFGSTSHKDETKIWRLDFRGVFRLMQFDAFLVPVTKQEFGAKAKVAIKCCMELALRVAEEVEARLADAPTIDFEQRTELEDAVSAIDVTTLTPCRSRTKRRRAD
ncbi:hypothetical protein BGZ70_010490 [Mortierella alpina]|uniref:Uncharacterized protein n=1 Tax=Mortierella alpina TaxID=64518 RepID=A0A9P6LZK8_MORAP|nr:hypothetical protein BGZ70_010490 [Mortierella alpina]